MGLTPDTAEALARSCRKSPWESPLCNVSANCGEAASGFVETPGLRPQEEERLLAAVLRKAVKDLYTHVRDEGRRRGNGEYLPLLKENSAK